MMKIMKGLKCGGKMYVILIYDLKDIDYANRQRNIHNICKKYLYKTQNSVFEGDITNVQFIKLKRELKQYVIKDKDSLVIFKITNKNWFKKEYVSSEKISTDNFI